MFVTGADGEQMVLSGPEAAALLAQAGISLGDQDQAADFIKAFWADRFGAKPICQESVDRIILHARQFAEVQYDVSFSYFLS